MRDPSIGLALGSGGAKGFAHIGVISALTENHIPIHSVAGSSMGSLVGACYAMGTPPRMMRGIAVSLKRRHWLDLTVPRMGLIQGNRVRELVSLLTRGGNIEDADIPLAIVATELVSRTSVVFRKGVIADAVRASISIPGVFVPAVHQGAVYVDGGVLSRVPTAASWDLGSDMVIGVDVGITPVGSKPTSMMDVIMQSLELMQDTAFAHHSLDATVTITPRVSHIGTAQFHRAEEAIELGYGATLERIPEIRAAMEQWSRCDHELHRDVGSEEHA